MEWPMFLSMRADGGSDRLQGCSHAWRFGDACERTKHLPKADVLINHTPFYCASIRPHTTTYTVPVSQVCSTKPQYRQRYIPRRK